jgi:hypothetical protein
VPVASIHPDDEQVGATGNQSSPWPRPSSFQELLAAAREVLGQMSGQ